MSNMLDSPEIFQNTVPPIDFEEKRSKVFLEIGPGSSLPMLFLEKIGYFDDQDANYVAIEEDPDTPSQSVKDQPWAAWVQKDVREVEGLDGQIDEVWTRNPIKAAPSSEKSWHSKLAEEAYKFLGPGGLFVFVDTQSHHGLKDKEILEGMIKKAGFNLTEQKDHPYIQATDDVERIEPGRKKLVVIARKPEVLERS